MSSKKNNGKEVGSKKNKIIYELAPYSTLGIQLVLTIGLCAWLGWFIDDYFKTEPIFLIIMSFFGAIAGMVSFIKSVIKRKK